MYGIHHLDLHLAFDQLNRSSVIAGIKRGDNDDIFQ